MRVLLTDRGTSALGLAIRLADEGRGRPVALPAWGCYDLATALVGEGLMAVAYDLDPESLAPEPDSLESALASGVGSVVVAPYFGVPFPVESIQEICERTGARLIVDAAQEAGASLRGRPLYWYGDLAVLSFGRGKGVTGGAGGALLVHDSELAIGARRAEEVLRAAGRGVAPLSAACVQWLLGRPSAYGLPASLPWIGLGETRYREPEPARGLPASAAGVLRKSWPEREVAAARRRRNARRLLGAMPSAVRPVRVREDATPGWLRLPVLVPRDVREAAASSDASRLGIAGGYPRILPSLPALAARTDPSGVPFPGAERLCRELITLPTHGLLRSDDLSRVAAWLCHATERPVPGG